MKEITAGTFLREEIVARATAAAIQAAMPVAPANGLSKESNKRTLTTNAEVR